MYGLSFNLGALEQIKNIDFEILSFIIFDTPYSPFLKRFLQGNSRLANGFCPNFGFNPQNNTFTIGFQDIQPLVNLDDPQFSWFDKSRISDEAQGRKNFGTVPVTKELLYEMIM